MTLSLTLPAPPTDNSLYRNGARGRYKTRRYMTWIRAADAHATGQNLHPVHGPYRLTITADCGRRLTKAGTIRKLDIANCGKAIGDWLVTHGIVEDDSLCEEVVIRWGWVGDGLCRVDLWPSNSAALPMEAAE